MSIKNIIIATIIAIAIIMALNTSFADWGITNASVNNSFIDIQQTTGIMGDALEVDPQVLFDGWHYRNNSVNVVWSSPVFQVEPGVEVGNALEVTPQILGSTGSGFHQRNNNFSNEFKYLTKINPELMIYDSLDPYSISWNMTGDCQAGVERFFKIYFDGLNDGEMVCPTPETLSLL